MDRAFLKLIATPDLSTGANAYPADGLVAQCLASAAAGEPAACFDLGVAFSTGSHGAPCDLVEAHKWFNLAALRGHEEAKHCRAEVAEEMTAREIAEAQRRARANGCAPSTAAPPEPAQPSRRNGVWAPR